MPDKKEIGERLRSLRGSRTQEEVAKALRVTTMAISLWESGQRMPNDDMKVKIATYYKKTVMSIFFKE